MHEIRISLRPEYVDEVAGIAALRGIGPLSVSDTEQLLPSRRLKTISVNLATPDACVFLNALKSSSVFQSPDFSVTSRELRAIINEKSIEEVTRPIGEPYEDVRQDLWQQCHITSSYLSRSIAAALLLACGIIDNKMIDIVVAALFLPFLAPMVAFALGFWGKDFKLVAHGLKALGTSIVICVLSGVTAAIFLPHTPAFHDFKGMSQSFVFAILVGVTAGLCAADDAGRRYLIGVAAAVQLSLFPVWFGISLINGFPPLEAVLNRALSFGISLTVIPVTAFAAYALLHSWNVRSKR